MEYTAIIVHMCRVRVKTVLLTVPFVCMSTVAKIQSLSPALSFSSTRWPIKRIYMTLLYDQIAHSQYQQKHWQHQQQQKALSVARVSLLLFNHLYDESVVYTSFF